MVQMAGDGEHDDDGVRFSIPTSISRSRSGPGGKFVAMVVFFVFMSGE